MSGKKVVWIGINNIFIYINRYVFIIIFKFKYYYCLCIVYSDIKLCAWYAIFPKLNTILKLITYFYNLDGISLLNKLIMHKHFLFIFLKKILNTLQFYI
jgi:hypothetical protein